MSNILNEVIPPLDFQLGNQQLEAIDGMITWYKSYTSNPKNTKNITKIVKNKLATFLSLFTLLFHKYRHIITIE